jgi:uncharacterized protein YecE (DUF72 family)
VHVLLPDPVTAPDTHGRQIPLVDEAVHGHLGHPHQLSDLVDGRESSLSETLSHRWAIVADARWRDTAASGGATIGGVAGTLFVGTSGFAYPEWKGHFYPEGMKDTEMLSFYGTRLPSVEINYTFRRFPVEKTLIRWEEQAQEGFRLALKANQRITHTKRLRDADGDVSEFLQRAKLLGDHLGPILFQCPPSLHFDRGLIESFVGYLPPIAPYAMEFRHQSWLEARDFLAENGVASCLAETDDTSVDAFKVPSEPFAYLRLRREDYSDQDIQSWADGIRPILDAGRDVYAFFKHEEGAAAPGFAQRLRDLVSPSSLD